MDLKAYQNNNHLLNLKILTTENLTFDISQERSSIVGMGDIVFHMRSTFFLKSPMLSFFSFHCEERSDDETI
jgi:hypothetical protein